MVSADLDWPIFGRDVAGVAWRPDRALLVESRLARFLRATGEADLPSLQTRAAADPAWFWEHAAADLGLAWQRPPRQILDVSGGAPWARWWGGGAFNYAVAAVDPRAARDPAGEALAWEGEDGEIRQLSNAALKEAVDRAAGMLRMLGVGVGDRVGIYLPMLTETVIAVLAVGRVGAIFTPIFSGYGAPAAASRLVDCEASVLITADGFLRRGTQVPLKATADEAVAAAPSVRHVIVVRRLGARAATPVPWVEGRDRWWDEAMDDPSVEPVLDPPETDPEAPCMILYTSGTTGRPKGAVHPHGGFPVKAAQDLAHTFDLRPGDRLFWLTDLGWMMGPWAIAGSLLLDASLVVYEGAHDYPGPDRLWSIAARHRVTHLGIAPTVVRTLMGHGTEPVRSHELPELRVLGSSGEPWNPDPWWWLFREVGGGSIPLINYSGGTEVSGGIVGCNVLTPIKPISFGGPNVGCAAEVLGPDARPLRGAVGELAITAPLPGMTRGFWNDPQRYLETYWSRVPDTWLHGDWALIDEDGYWFIHGRSDDTLKIAGKRVGPAEVESAAVGHPSVLEAAAIGVPHPLKGEAIALLCVLRRGETDDPDLRSAIARHVASVLGKALRPDAVHCVTLLPKTRSGKVMRRVARATYLGLDPGDLSTLEDPSAIEAIRRVAAG